MFERYRFPRTRSTPGRRQARSAIALTCGALGLASACLNPAISDEAPVSEAIAVLDVDDAVDAGVEAVDDAPETPPTPSSTPPERSRGEVRTRGTRRR